MQSIIIQHLYHIVKKHPAKQAIWVNGCYYSYKELFNRSCALSKAFLSISQSNSICAIYCERNIFAYLAILGALFAGKAYMPLNKNFPLERNLRMLEEARPEILFLDTYHVAVAIKLLRQLPTTNVCLCNKDLLNELVQAIPRHNYLCLIDFDQENIFLDEKKLIVSQDDYAYLMFTSGSTGKPKGIVVKHKNLSEYVNSFCQTFSPATKERFLQLTELTFDLSVHEMFVCWSVGATLYVVPENYLFNIKKFIQEHQITSWLSVPSMITLLNQLGQLKPGYLSSLKNSYFCGESFLQSQALLWRSAAPESSIVNLYGPTEATVTFTYFNWSSAFSSDQPPVMPIGIPFRNQYCVLVDDVGMPSKDGEIGELYLSGTQVIDAYWDNHKQTAGCFKTFSWDNEMRTWYRTGDLAKWDNKWGYIYAGRLDDQWQIRGVRVEKLEIENELRKIIGDDAIAIVPIASLAGQIDGVVVFVCNDIEQNYVIKKAREILPDVMIPKKVIKLSSLPKNSSGKVDYRFLSSLTGLD